MRRVLEQVSGSGHEGPGTPCLSRPHFWKGWPSREVPPCRRAREWAGEGWRSSEPWAGWPAAFCQELEAIMIRSHGALVLAPVLALLPTCCVTFGK